jgi:hypothetical protein
LEAAQSRTDLQSVIESLRSDFGVDHLVYHWVNAKGSEMGVGTYSELWVERYKSQGYINIDPVILGCLQKFHPVNWKELDWTSKAARSFLR